MNEFERELSAHVDGLTPPVPPPYDEVVALRGRRRTRRRAAVGVVGSAAVVAAIIVGASALRPDGSSGGSPVTAADSTPTSAGIPDVAPDWDQEGPPPVFLQLDGEQVVLEPWTSCYGNMCSDGFPQPPFADVGDRATVPFSFPLQGWEFGATFTPMGGGDCARGLTLPARSTGTYTFEVPLVGSPGDYQVDLFGRGPGGDVITTFRWSTSSTGEFPEPSAVLSVLTDNDDELDSYGIDLYLRDLGKSPEDATARITVTSANGASRTFGPLRNEAGCFGAGTLSFTGEERDGQRAVALGPAPFDYRAEVTIDGTTYVGTAVWPRDEKPDEAPYTTLTFDPPLPAYTG